jgi:hypothetical protein
VRGFRQRRYHHAAAGWRTRYGAGSHFGAGRSLVLPSRAPFPTSRTAPEAGCARDQRLAPLACVRSRCSATFACSGWFNGPGIGAFRRGKGGGRAGGSSRRPGRSRRSIRLRPWSGAARRIAVRDAQRPRRVSGDQCHSGSHEIKALLVAPRRSGSLPARPAGSTRSALDRSHPLPAKAGHLAWGLGWLPAMSAARLLANCQVAARKRR